METNPRPGSKRTKKNASSRGGSQRRDCPSSNFRGTKVRFYTPHTESSTRPRFPMIVRIVRVIGYRSALPVMTRSMSRPTPRRRPRRRPSIPGSHQRVYRSRPIMYPFPSPAQRRTPKRRHVPARSSSDQPTSAQTPVMSRSTPNSTSIHTSLIHVPILRILPTQHLLITVTDPDFVPQPTTLTDVTRRPPMRSGRER